MRPFPEDTPRRYVIVNSDPYESERDDLYLHLNRTLGPTYAGRWLEDLALAVGNLTGFPGPLSHARDEEATDHYGREVRRLLYYGPTRKRSGTPIRILFTILPPNPDELPETAESVIFLLRLLRSGQVLSMAE